MQTRVALPTWTGSRISHPEPARPMARWPRNLWTTLFTYGAIVVLFPILCWLAYSYVRGK